MCRKRRAEDAETASTVNAVEDPSEPMPTKGLTLGQRLEALQLRQQGVSIPQRSESPFQACAASSSAAVARTYHHLLLLRSPFTWVGCRCRQWKQRFLLLSCLLARCPSTSISGDGTAGKHNSSSKISPLKPLPCPVVAAEGGSCMITVFSTANLGTC